MATDLPQAEPSEGLRDRLRAAVERDRAGARRRRQSRRPPSAVPATPRGPDGRRPRRTAAGRPSRARRWRRALPLGWSPRRVAAIVGLGIWNVVLTSDRSELQATVAEQSADRGRPAGPGAGDDRPAEEPTARTVATVVARGDEVRRHHPRAVGQRRRRDRPTCSGAWAERRPQPLGTFDVTGHRWTMQTVGSGLTGLDQFDAYGISLEPGQEAPSLPTEVVATGQVTS